MKVLESLSTMNDTLKNIEQDYENLIHKMDSHPGILSSKDEQTQENPTEENITQNNPE